MKKKTFLPSVSVALSALNEEGNIANCLIAILNQKEDKFKIKSIIIHSDGSTDNTVRIIKTFKDPRIIIHEHKGRKGKSFRLNQIYRELKTDFLVQTDADTVFANDQVVSEMMKPFLKDSEVMMCGGNIVPTKPSTFTEKAIFCTYEVYKTLRFRLKNGNNMYSASGGILAYRKEFCKKIHIPETMIGNDVFTYFLCKLANFKYRFARKAIVYYRLPQTFSDQVKQNSRNVASLIRCRRYFSKDLMEQELAISPRMKYGLLLKTFISNPIYCTYIYFVNLYGLFHARKNEKKMDNKWQMIKSTKVLG